ncbi:threonine dehydrogenase-like Zn-dependent dehydrogenase [Bosea sp. BE125]|uniref:zinc-dependent alcohol dehydrogenase n=1 Tax=Bosea sp. BE125 TaxID=2817909 RepID=UPI002856878B|nr:alcohol dehydrogenase catalytic domain-containing protein [Bosea sp. BE125]MDR6874373.1 threonine dehydrogenase-like Zn-dependent dehydrogenase [Bosea sp. BE125]
MLALRKLAPEPGIALCDISEPAAPGPDEVVVAITAAGICGTDLHIADWTAGYAAMAQAMPVTMGHEFAGRVARLGDAVSDLRLGDRVVIRPSVVCGQCERCRTGQAEDCVTRRGIGIMRDGGFAALACVPAENCVPVPEPLSDTLAALTEPMTVSAEAVDTAGVRQGDSVLIIGPGTIGQGIALFTEAAGADRIVIAGYDDAARLATLREMGFVDTLDTIGTSLRKGLERAGLPVSYDRIIEAAGVPTLVGEALDLLALRGVLTICGIHAKPAAVDLTSLVRRHQQIRGSYRAPLATWPRVLGYLAAHSARISHMITEEVALADASAAFARAKNRSASKIMLRP